MLSSWVQLVGAACGFSLWVQLAPPPYLDEHEGGNERRALLRGGVRGEAEDEVRSLSEAAAVAPEIKETKACSYKSHIGINVFIGINVIIYSRYQ